MRFTYLWAGLILAGVATLPARAAEPLINPTGGELQLPADASVDDVLDALDQTGQKMREFTAKVTMITGDANVGGITRQTGTVWFQKKGDEDGRLRVTFDKKTVGRITRADKVEYKLENGELVDRDYHKRAQTTRQVSKPGEKTNLLKLGEGPFPLPIGQKKQDVRKMFDVTVIPPGSDEAKDKDLADTIHLRLKPKEGTRFARRFGAIDVWVSRQSKFPVKIRTVAPDGESDEHITKLENVQVNPAGGLKESDFDLGPIDKESWSLHTEPYRE